MKLTSEQIENTKVAYSIMAGIPAEKIRLNVWRQSTHTGYGTSDKDLINKCGSVGCIGGWLSAHPYFKERGLTSVNVDWDQTSKKLFGTRRMFAAGAAGLPGKREALARLRNHLFYADAITLKRDQELRVYENSLTA